jgi:hypothetical protein
LAGVARAESGARCGAGRGLRAAPGGRAELGRANSQAESGESRWHKGAGKRPVPVGRKVKKERGGRQGPGSGWSRA